METLVAWVCTRPDGLRRPERVARLKRHYGPLHEAEVPVVTHDDGQVGLVLLRTPTVDTRWPMWLRREDRVVASCYTPVGVEQITSEEPDGAPFALVDALLAAPERIFDLMPPFVCAQVEGGSLDVFTDGLGVGRLFEVRTPWGWVWSNRPLAALLFSGMPVRPDPVAWAQSAVADGFYGERSPYQGVRVVGPATHLRWDARSQRLSRSSLDVTSALLTPDPETCLDALVEEAAADLTATTASIARWYPGTPTVDLSGGRDSRLVAAAFLAGGTDVVLHSHDAVPGDLVVATELVSRLPREVPHRITHMATGPVAAPRPVAALDSARAWHAYAEGLRPSSYLHHEAPRTLACGGRVVVGGAGGEVAHGYYYGRDDGVDPVPFEAALIGVFADPVASFTEARDLARRVVARHCPRPAVTEWAREDLVAVVTAEVEGFRVAGVPGPTVLDHVYLAERLRRWGSTAERLGIASPLLTPSFHRAALALAPHQRRANEVHRRLTERLMPAWEGVPYFPGEVVVTTSGAPHPPAPRVVRVADCTDAPEIEAIVAAGDDLNHPFRTEVLADYWRRSLDGTSTAVEERYLRSAVWRAAFQDHTADVSGVPRRVREGTVALATPPVSAVGASGHPSPQVTAPATADTPPPPIPSPAPPPVTSPAGTPGILRSPVVRRLGHSAVWQGVRDTAPGRALRRTVRALAP